MMKKLLMILTLMTGSLSTYAENYPYLTFVQSDGTKISVNASSLTISVSGTTLTAGSQSFTLSNLSKMYFSTTDETNSTGIEALQNSGLTDEDAEYYDLNGRQVTRNMMHKGVYIVKSKNGTYKLTVK